MSSAKNEACIDPKLIDHVLAGDKAAAEDFASVLRPRLFKWFRWLLRNQEEAEDLTQEAFAELWCALPTFRGESKVETFAYRIAHNVYEKRLRRHRMEVRAMRKMALEEQRESVREALERISLREMLADALGQLTEEKRQAIILVKVQGLKSKEAAAVLGIPEGTVRWHVMEGLNKMRRLLERQEDTIECEMPSS